MVSNTIAALIGLTILALMAPVFKNPMGDNEPVSLIKYMITSSTVTSSTRKRKHILSTKAVMNAKVRRMLR